MLDQKKPFKTLGGGLMNILKMTCIFLFSFTALTSVAQGHFPSCPQKTSDVRLAEDMIRSTLGYMAPFNSPLTGRVGGIETSIQLIDKRGALYFNYERKNKIYGSASVCTKRGEVWVESSSQFGNYTFILKAGGKYSLRVGKPGIPGSATLTAKGYN